MVRKAGRQKILRIENGTGAGKEGSSSSPVAGSAWVSLTNGLG